MNLSGYVFEALRKDEEFILYRGQRKDIGSQVLVLSHGFRSHGMGSLPHCKATDTAQRAVAESPALRLCNHHEAAGQDC